MPANLLEVAGLFLRLGLTAFGGPAAHIALYREEAVRRRGWLSEQEFLDMLGVTNLIPGPNSTEMAIHLGLRRAGWAGLLAAGVCFVLPAALISAGFAWAYVEYGSTPQAGWLLYGVKPVMIAIILQALVGLGRKALNDRLTQFAGLLAGLLSFTALHPLAVLALAGGLVFAGRNLDKFNGRNLAGLAGAPILGGLLASPAAYSTGLLFLTFLKIGAVLYGSGYVLLAFLRADFVVRLGWLTDQQLLDAITVGQITPGPVFSAATFIGYLLGGPGGAFWATLGIFLPSFIFVLIISPHIARLRASPLAASLLDGVNAASLGLMATVTLQLGRASLVDAPTLLIAGVSLALVSYTRTNPTWIVLAGGLAGFILKGM